MQTELSEHPVPLMQCCHEHQVGQRATLLGYILPSGFQVFTYGRMTGSDNVPSNAMKKHQFPLCIMAASGFFKYTANYCRSSKRHILPAKSSTRWLPNEKLMHRGWCWSMSSCNDDGESRISVVLYQAS
jgi:hypothetical protein